MKEQKHSAELLISGISVRLVFRPQQNHEAAAAVQNLLKRVYLQRVVRA